MSACVSQTVSFSNRHWNRVRPSSVWLKIMLDWGDGSSGMVTLKG
jgi:hypothetical protein